MRLSFRESLRDGGLRERRNARRGGYENRGDALEYVQEYAGKVGEKRKVWRSQVVPNNAEDRGPCGQEIEEDKKNNAKAWEHN